MIENTVGIFPAPHVSANPGERAAQASMLDIDFGEHSDIGKVRDTNEDSHGHVAPSNPAQARSHGWFFVLADGAGGHERGEVASHLAVESVVEGFRASRASEPHTALLPRLVEKANLEVYEAGRSAAPGGAHMATTMVACSLGHDLFVNVDVNQTQVVPGDVLLLCCDGMHGALEESDMARIVTQNRDLNEAAQQLVALANERDGSDNISVQLIRIKSVERVGMYRG